MIGALTLGLIGIVIPTVIALQHFAGLDPLAWLLESFWSGQKVMEFRTDHLGARIVGGVFITVLATLVCLYNFWCYLYWLYHRRQGNKEGGFSSGIPVIGSFFLLGAVAVMPESVFWGIFFLMLYATDAEGFAWIMVFGLREWWDTGSLPR